MTPKSNIVAKFGLSISILSASLDFVSGSQLLQITSMTDNEGMSMQSPISTETVLASLLFFLGVLIIVTGVIGVLRVSMKRMNIVGGLMITYGIIMILIGMTMVDGTSPMMGWMTFSGIGMHALGLMMIVNGVIMVKSSRAQKKHTS